MRWWGTQYKGLFSQMVRRLIDYALLNIEIALSSALAFVIRRAQERARRYAKKRWLAIN